MAWSGWRETRPGGPHEPGERGRGYSGGRNFGGMYGGYFAGRYGGDYYPPARIHHPGWRRGAEGGPVRPRHGAIPGRWGGGAAPPEIRDAYGLRPRRFRP